MATVPNIPITDALKLRFAAALARTRNAGTAALSVITDNPGEALRQSYLLPTDPIVVAELERIHGVVPEADLLPSKCELARKVLARAEACTDNEEYGKLMKLYCDMMGHIEKPGTSVDVNVQVAPVMVVRDHGTNEEWAAKAIAQQRGLVLDATQ